MALGDTRKEPCKYCLGPGSECEELRGGFMPNLTCKKRPTYDQLWDMYTKLDDAYQAIFKKLLELEQKDLTKNGC